MTLDKTNDLIIAVAMELQADPTKLSEQATKIVNKVNKQVEGGFSLGLDEKTTEKFQKTVNTYVKKLKGINLFGSFSNIFQLIGEGKTGVEAYGDAINQLGKDVDLLYSHLRQRPEDIDILGKFNSSQIDQVINKLNAVEVAKNKLALGEEKAQNKINSILNKRLATEKQLVASVNARSIPVEGPTKVGKGMGLSDDFVSKNQALLTTYSRLHSLGQSLVEDKEQYAEIKTVGDAEKVLEITQKLADVQKWMLEIESKFKQQGIAGKDLLSTSLFKDVDLSKSAFDTISNQYVSLMTQSLQSAVQDAMDKVQKHVVKQASAIHEKFGAYLSGHGTGTGTGTGLGGAGGGTGSGSDDDAEYNQIKQYIVDADTAVKKIKELQKALNNLEDDDDDEKYETLYLELLKYYARLKDLNPKLENISRNDISREDLDYYKASFGGYYDDSTLKEFQTQIDLIRKYKDAVNESGGSGTKSDSFNELGDKDQSSKLAEVESALKSAKEEAEKFKIELSDAKKEIDVLSQTANEVQNLKSQLSQSSTQIEDLKNQNAELSQFKQELDKVNQELIEAKRHVDELQKEKLSNLGTGVGGEHGAGNGTTSSTSIPDTSKTLAEIKQELENFERLKKAIDPLIAAIQQKNIELTKEGTIAQGVVSREILLFEKLKNKLIEVKSAIEDKTNAFLAEEKVVSQIATSEVNKLQPLKDILDIIVSHLSQIGKSPIYGSPINITNNPPVPPIDPDILADYATLNRLVEEYEAVAIRIARNKKLNGDEQLKANIETQIKQQETLIQRKNHFNQALHDEYLLRKKQADIKESNAKSAYQAQSEKDLQKYITSVLKSASDKDNVANKAEEYHNKIKLINKEIEKLINHGKFDFFDQDDIDEINNTKKAIAQLFSDLNNKSFNIIDPEKITSAQTSWENWRKANSKAEGQFKSSMDAISAEFKRLSGLTEVTQEDFQKLNSEVAKLKNRITQVGKTGQSFFDIWRGRMKSLFAWLSSFVGFQEVLSVFRTGVGYVKEFDTAMTDLRKVTDASNKELDEFQTAAASIASDLGALTNTVVQATTEWSRLGESIDDAIELAKASTIYANVGDIDATTASTDLVSAMKAFDIEAENAMRVVDSLNEIGNNYAVSSAQLGEILEKSSSALAVSGDSIDQVVAMGAAMNEIVQDSSITGTTLKMLSLRIRGASTEIEQMGESTDGMAESTSKLREQIKALTNTDGTGGFDIMQDNNTFKTTYDIMKGIAQYWENMSQIDQSALLELIAGKNRAQGAAALIKNFAKAESALVDSLNSEGSAMRENERYMESVEGHLNVLRNEYQRLWTEGINKDFLNFWIDLGTSVMEVINGIGMLNSGIIALSTAAGAIMTKDGTGFISKEGILEAWGAGQGGTNNAWFVGLKQLNGEIANYNALVSASVDEQTNYLDALTQTKPKLAAYFNTVKMGDASVKGYIGSLIKMTAQQAAATLGAMALNTAISLGASLLIEGAIWAVSKFVGWVDEIFITSKEAAEQTKALTSSLKDLNSSINDNIRNLDKLAGDYVRLSEGVDALGNNISLTDDEYAEYLDISNQIAELTPSMVNHWDAQGNAILKTIDNVNELTEAYEKEAQAAAQAYLISGKDENGNKRKAIYKNYKKNFLENDDLQSAIEFIDQESFIQRRMTPTELNELLNDPYGDFYELRQFLDENGIDWINEDNLEQSYSLINSYLQKLQNDYQAAAKSIGQDALTIARASSEYWDMDDDVRSSVDSFLTNITNDMVDGLGLTTKEATNTFITSLIAALSDPNSTHLDDALLGLFSLDLSEKSIPEAEQLVTQYANLLVESLKKIDPNSTVTVEDIVGQFGLENVYDLSKAYQTNLSNWTTQASESSTLSSEYLKKAIDDFATRFSINTQDEMAYFNQCMEEAEGDYRKAMSKYILGMQENISYNERISAIENLHEGLDPLGEVYKDVKDGGTFNWDSILNNEDFAKQFGGYTDAYNDFIKIVTNSPDDINACQQAFDNLVTEYINGSQALSGLNEETKDATIAFLKQKGVVNAEVAVNKALNQVLAQQQLQRILLSEEKIDSEEEVNELRELMDAAGHTAETITTLTRALAVLNAAETNPAIVGSEVYDWALQQLQMIATMTSQIKFDEGDLEFGLGSGEDQFAELFDFFERRIEVIQQSIDLLDASLENVFGSGAKNQLISQQSSILNKQIGEYAQAEQMYNEAANHYLSRLDATTQEQIKNGSLDVRALIGTTDEAIKANLEGYVEWADKAADCKQQIAELKEELRDLELEKFNNIIEDFTNQFDLFGESIDLIEQQIGFLESAGQVIPESFYTTQIEQTQKQLSTLEAQKSALITQLQSSLASGLIEAGTDEWLEMVQAIGDVESSILDSKTALEELDTALRQLHWDMFDRIQDQFDQISDEAGNMIDLLNDSTDIQVSDGHGNWTDEAITAMGLYAQQYETALYQVQEYEQAIAELTQQFNNGEITTTEYLEKLGELNQGKWEAVQAAEAVEDAIISLNETRVNEEIEVIQEEIEAYKELTDAQIESLDAQKDLHDYQKSIAESSKNIADIQRQLAALEYDDSAAATAKKAQLREQLAEANSEREELEYEHSIESQKEALTKQAEDYEETRNEEIEQLKESLKNREYLISQSFDTVKQNADTVGVVIERIANEHGITISKSLTGAWEAGSNAISSYGTVLSSQSSAFIITLQGVETEMWDLQDQAEKTYGAIATTFATRADGLVLELQESWTAADNLREMADALNNSFVSALSGSYDVSGIVDALEKIEDAANSAAAAVSGLNSNNSGVYVEGHGSGAGNHIMHNTNGVNKNQIALYSYAKGGLVTKDDNNPLNNIAKAVGEDSIIAAKEGEGILTPIQTEAMLKLAPFLSKLNNNFSTISSLNNFKSGPLVDSAKSVGNNIQVGSLVTVNGNVDDNNLKKITDIVKREVNNQFAKWNRDFVYSGY